MSLQRITYPLFSIWHSLKTSRPILFLSDWIRYLTQSLSKKEEGIFLESVIFRPISRLRHSTETEHLFLYEDYTPTWKDIKEALKTTEYKECKVGDSIDIYYTVVMKTPDGTYSTKSYIAPYTYPFPISFPPYSLEDLKEYKGEEPTVILSCSRESEHEKHNYTDVCQLYSGPKHNFYSDLPLRHGLRVWREHIIPPIPDIQLNIINSDGASLMFKPYDLIDWLHLYQEEPSDVRNDTFAFKESESGEGPSKERPES